MEVDDDAHGLRGEELVNVPLGVGDGFEHEDGFEEEVGRAGIDDAETGGAGGGVKEEIEGVAHKGMVGGDEADVFAGDGAAAVEGGEHAVAGDGREALDVGVIGVEEDVAVFVFFDAHAVVVEQFDEEAAPSRVGLGGAHLREEFFGGDGVEGGELEEAVAAAVELVLQGNAEGGGGGEEVGDFGGGGEFAADGMAGDEGEHTLAELGLELGATVEGAGEGGEAGVIPSGEELAGGIGEVGDVEADGLGLADAVEAADALLDEAGVERQVEEHEVVGELEVAAFAADLGTEEELGAGGLGKPSGLAVALDEGEAFVEEAGFEGGARLDGGVEGGDFARVAADEEDLALAVGEEEIDEPKEAGVVLEVVAQFVGAAGFLGLDLAGDAGEEGGGGGGVVGRDGEGDGVVGAAGETAHGGAGVAEDDAAGAVLVEQGSEEGIAGAGRGGGEGSEVGGEAGGVAVEDFFEGTLVGGGEGAGLDDFFGDGGDGAVAFGLLDEAGKVAVAVGVEEAQAGEVAFGAELGGGGGEEEEAGGARGELLDEVVCGADRGGVA